MASVPPPLAFPHPGPPPEAPELPEGARPPAPRWPAWTAPVSLIAGFAGAIGGYVVLTLIGGIAGADVEHPPPGITIAATVLQDAALVASALLFARMAARPRAWHFGLRGTRFWPAVGWIVLAWLSFIFFSAAWIALLGIHQRDDLPDELGADRSTAALVAVGVLVTIVAPVAEELFFRGYFFTALRSWRGVWPAAILTGLVFGGIHAGSAPAGFLVPLAAFGFILCLLYWRTGSLIPGIALHSLNNCLAFGVSQHWDWQIPVLMVGALTLLAGILSPLRGGGRHASNGISRILP